MISRVWGSSFATLDTAASITNVAKSALALGECIRFDDEGLSKRHAFALGAAALTVVRTNLVCMPAYAHIVRVIVLVVVRSWLKVIEDGLWENKLLVALFEVGCTRPKVWYLRQCMLPQVHLSEGVKKQRRVKVLRRASPFQVAQSLC
tara:strand:+ start:203 stop:646 length:444 start_codon:yes stop_codon:yes gene_type:complete